MSNTTATPTTDQLVAAGLRDAAHAHLHVTRSDRDAEIRIYEDPNVGGLAWDCWTGDECQSGGIGYDRDQYSDYDAQIVAVCTELRREGYEVDA